MKTLVSSARNLLIPAVIETNDEGDVENLAFAPAAEIILTFEEPEYVHDEDGEVIKVMRRRPCGSSRRGALRIPDGFALERLRRDRRRGKGDSYFLSMNR